MNYMVIGPCTITFLLIANSLLVFCEKYPLYFDFIYYVMFFNNKGMEKGNCAFYLMSLR
jgi:hypothetical protein